MGPVCLAEGRGVLRILTQAIEIKGSGFPLRRERRGWGFAPILTSSSRGKEDVQDAPAAVYDAIALFKSPFSFGGLRMRLGARSFDRLRMKSKGLRMMMVGGSVLRQAQDDGWGLRNYFKSPGQ